MPALIITTVDGGEKLIEDTAALEAEIARFEEALQAIIPDLEGDDDEVGILSANCYQVINILLIFFLQELNSVYLTCNNILNSTEKILNSI